MTPLSECGAHASKQCLFYLVPCRRDRTPRSAPTKIIFDPLFSIAAAAGWRADASAFRDNHKFENEEGGALRLDYAVAAVDTADAEAELERRFLDFEMDRYTIEKIVEATTLQARMLELPCVLLA